MQKHSQTLLARIQPLTGPAPRDPVAIEMLDGKIVNISPAKQRRRSNTVRDLRDTWVTPGLVDSHTHFFYWGLRRSLAIDVSGAISCAEAVKTLQRESRRRKVGDWVVGVGFDHNVWGTGFPTSADLDLTFSDTPVIVSSRDCHSVWLNSAGLKEFGIHSQTPDPPGGSFGRDEHGRLTGIAYETAADQLPRPIETFAKRTDAKARAVIDRAMADAFIEARRMGLVGVHSMDGAASFGHLQRLHGAGQLGLNVVHAIPIRNLDSAITLGLRSGLGDDRFRIGGTKIFADGALGSQTALMFADYPDRPGYNGVGVYSFEELSELADRAVAHGWALWIHAIGDLAVDHVSKAIAKAAKLGDRNLVHRIEHVQCARPAAIRRMGKYGIVAAVQPCHVPGDIQTAERHWPKASRNAYPFRQLLDAGVVLSLGSDVPVERIDPRLSLWAAVCRTDEQGQPAGGWYADQRISLREALIGFTRGSAIAAGLPEPYGQLKIGAPADLTVWGCDPLKLKPDELRDAPILGVIHAGQPCLI